MVQFASYFSSYKWPYYREFKQQRFWARNVNRKWTFCTLQPYFWTNLWAKRPFKSKDTKQYKFGSVKISQKRKTLTSGWRASLKNVAALTP